MCDFRRITLFCLEFRLSKNKMTIFSTNLGWAMAPLPPLATPMHHQDTHSQQGICVNINTVFDDDFRSSPAHAVQLMLSNCWLLCISSHVNYVTSRTLFSPSRSESQTRGLRPTYGRRGHFCLPQCIFGKFQVKFIFQITFRLFNLFTGVENARPQGEQVPLAQWF